MGFRREIVKGVAVFFGTVLILVLIFASSDGEESKKEAASLPIAKEEELRRQAEENAKNAAKNQTVEPANVVETQP